MKQLGSSCNKSSLTKCSSVNNSLQIIWRLFEKTFVIKMVFDFYIVVY